jgi:predicted lipoprotein with Yx(FWY)xxD motif
MTRSKPITFLASAALIPLAALAVAACGGGGSAATAATPKTTSGAPATVGVANSSLGSILVNSTGRTLYLFKADSGTMSACTGACATAWPPLLANGTPTAGTGLTASKLGTITRSGGNRQVTYNGHPLYLFIKDTKPGQTTGQGVTAFGAAWFVVSPAGNQISTGSKGHGSASSSSRPAAPAAPPVAKAQPAPKAAPQPAPKPAPKPAPPVAKPAPPANNGIPQNNGGDGDSDNNGGPSDGDGNI